MPRNSAWSGAINLGILLEHGERTLLAARHLRLTFAFADAAGLSLIVTLNRVAR
jgi:hypothetical protein